MKGMRCEKQGEGPLLTPPRQPVYARVLGLLYTTVLCCSVPSQAERLSRPPHIVGLDEKKSPSGQSRMATLKVSQLLHLYIAVHTLQL